jgi:hypothetical protein
MDIKKIIMSQLECPYELLIIYATIFSYYNEQTRLGIKHHHFRFKRVCFFFMIHSP